MTLKLTEGFADMSTIAKFAAKGWTHTDAVSSLQSGRLGGQCWRFTRSGGTGGTAKKTIPGGTYTQFVAGLAFNFTQLPSSDTLVVALQAGSTATVQIFLNTTGKISIRNSSGTTIATGTAVLSTGSWNYIEVKAVINGASGSCATQINSASDIATTTGNFGSTGVDTYLFSFNAPVFTDGNGFSFTDLYFLDTSASPHNDFLGDATIETIRPTADGAHTDWTPSSGTNHFDRVNEASGTFPDDDTTYVSDATVGHRDSYAFGNLASLSGTVFCVKTNLYARKDDAGTRQIAAVARPGVTDRDGATATLSTSYVVYEEIRETNPDTSAAWTISEVNASEFGVKTVA